MSRTNAAGGRSAIVGTRPTGQGHRREHRLFTELGRSGWNASVKLHMPKHVHLLVLPPYSPELRPAEHLWPLTNTVLANEHFATLDDLEEALARRCAALQACRDLVRSTTLFHWWPRRVKKRPGPRRT